MRPWLWFTLCGGVGALWGYLGALEINRCNTCGKLGWGMRLLLGLCTWPVHYYERKKHEKRQRVHP